MNPLRQLRRIHRPHLDEGTDRFQLGEPLGGLGFLVDLGNDQQQQVVGIGTVAINLQRFFSGVVELAFLVADFQDLAITEQRHAVAGLQHIVPVEIVFHREQIALAGRNQRGPTVQVDILIDRAAQPHHDVVVRLRA